MSDWHLKTARQIAGAISDGQSAVEVVEHFLRRMTSLNPQIGAMTQVFSDHALDRAKAVDRGEVSGLLAGVPVVVKDNICTRRGRTTCSSRMLSDYHSPFDATVVEKLEAAGAIVIGKTNLDEFAMGASTETSHYGPSRNPWDTERVPGGSSGGSAAALACGMASSALGTDTGGSIRQPASFCGMVGMKPTYGRVSRWGLVAFASSLDQIGPLTRDIDDAALMMRVIAGHDPRDATSAPDRLSGGVPDYLKQIIEPPRKLRLGLARQFAQEQATQPVLNTMENVIRGFGEMGAELVEVDLPHAHYGIPVYYLVGTAEASSNLARYDGVHFGHQCSNPKDIDDLIRRSRHEGFGDEVKRRIMLGTFALSSGYYDAYYLRALKVRRLIKEDFDKAFEQCDAIILPTSRSPAYPLATQVDDPVQMYIDDIFTVPCNLAGIVGLSMPGGWVSPPEKNLASGKERDAQLPVGVQLLGPAFSETRLLSIARMWQQHQPELFNRIAEPQA